jgi:hypothetical protein
MSSTAIRRENSRKRTSAQDTYFNLDKYDQECSRSGGIVDPERVCQQLVASDVSVLRELKAELESTDWMFDRDCGSGSLASLSQASSK